ncbi:hypothetical protein EBZ80_06610 [bacterium]|nr:hypothetical protein [bacterium]
MSCEELLELIDSIAPYIPEGLYLRLCTAVRTVYQKIKTLETTNHERRRPRRDALDRLYTVTRSNESLSSLVRHLRAENYRLKQRLSENEAYHIL